MLERYWQSHPELRLAQIVSNAHVMTREQQGRELLTRDPFYFSDEELERWLRNELGRGSIPF